MFIGLAKTPRMRVFALVDFIEIRFSRWFYHQKPARHQVPEFFVLGLFLTSPLSPHHSFYHSKPARHQVPEGSLFGGFVFCRRMRPFEGLVRVQCSRLGLPESSGGWVLRLGTAISMERTLLAIYALKYGSHILIVPAQVLRTLQLYQ